MPIHTPWRPARKDHVRLNVPQEAGVYELKSFGRLVYIGRAENLRAAILEDLEERTPNNYRWETPDLLESVDDLYEKHRQRYQRQNDSQPPWNASREPDDEPPADEDATATEET